MCNTPNQDTEGRNKKTILIAVLGMHPMQVS